MTERKTAVGLDFDGVMVRKPKGFDIPRRATKMGLPPVEGIHDALSQMRFAYDLSIAGVYTVRPSWLRGGQTRRQVERHGFGEDVSKVVHTNNSPKDKIRTLLLDTVAARCNFGAPLRLVDQSYRPGGEHDSAILVDDSYAKIIGGIEALGEDPQTLPLLNHLVFFAFGKEQVQINTGKDYDPLTAFVLPHDLHIKWVGDPKGVQASVPIIGLPSWDRLGESMDKLKFLREHPYI